MKKINDNVWQLICNNIAAECAMKGINARFEVKTGKDWRGDKYKYIESETFTIFPAIVANTRVSCLVYSIDGATWDDEKMNHLQPVCADIRVTYSLPDNSGTNGHAIGRIIYGIDYTQDNAGEIATKDVQFYI